MAGNRIIGIDLGTTFSAVAIVNKNGLPAIIANREGERITPSVVFFDGESPIVGTIAKTMALSAPLNVVQFVKRQMGNSNWRFQTENGTTFTPEDMSAFILKRLKEDAEAALGEVITEAVISVPAYFNDAQRQATKDAARIAGLNVVRMLNEPTAAALAYGLTQDGPLQTVLVYDLGGGTFDVTILRVGSGEVTVIATGGDKNLGGFDWDNCLMNHLNEEFKKEGGPDLLEDPEDEANLRAKCEIAKRTLSSREKAAVHIGVKGKSVAASITRDQFEAITESLFKRTISIMEFVLEDAGLNWRAIDKVLLVGGSTRMKGVARWITNVTGISPSSELHPDEVVAMGAAVQAALLQRESGSLILAVGVQMPVLRLADVNSQSLGVIALDSEEKDFNSIIVPKNTKFPGRACDTFVTVVDNQKQIHLQVTQGEGKDPDYVNIMGHTNIPLPPYPKGSPIEVVFEFDLSGQIVVTVNDLVTKQKLGESFAVFARLESLPSHIVEQKRLAMSQIAIN